MKTYRIRKTAFFHDKKPYYVVYNERGEPSIWFRSIDEAYNYIERNTNEDILIKYIRRNCDVRIV